MRDHRQQQPQPQPQQQQYHLQRGHPNNSGSNLLKMCRWFGRGCFIAYMVSSIFLITYLSSKSTQLHVTEATMVATKHTNTNTNNNINNSSNVGTLSTSSAHATATTTAPLLVPTREELPIPETDTYFPLLRDAGAERSMQHQLRFLARKDKIASTFEYSRRFQSELDVYAAVLLSETFAFLHIWKCGGTTIASMMGEEQWPLNATDVQQRQWVAFVRDPIDRFLSAWAECGYRQLRHSIEKEGLEQHTVLNWLDGEYDFRVRAFLNEVKDFTFVTPELTCHTHAHPQVNFMINPHGQIDDHMAMVGDLSEMKPVLQIAGLENFKDDTKGRDARSNSIKTEKFPSHRNLLKDQTLLELCDFYAMDYYLFDFEPPLLCVQPGAPLEKLYR